MKLSYDQRLNTGAFYTPKMWADFCVERLQRVLPTFDGFTFYDPAAGEGALLDALPDGTDCYASTIESKDVEILRAKGYEAEQFDFLTMNTRFLHPNILAASEEGTLVVLTNPPYFKLPANRYALMKRLYPAHCADSVCMFLLRIVRELHPCMCNRTPKSTTVLKWQPKICLRPTCSPGRSAQQLAPSTASSSPSTSRHRRSSTPQRT